MFYVVAFDISDDRTRYRAVKVLKAFGYRVQKSVFECPDLTEKRFLRLKDRLEALIDFTTDSVRYYRQCRACLDDCEVSGLGELPEVKDYKVV
ncbi:CRISPR-associated endonuclease Cas2 [Desulfoglaeba alkanexedens]|uniref:CRISPR-associated endoribonuclease Cas2 n=1 Tax=Desulfoglaeba alkanexedens ALDC TaxID=980445 RepID=A0A4P8L7P1_9BACT|nr:CRISPR-associated endonuclease Cas2 [Desulfoglaeba alkanexedens]QCQ23215.1 CRISPR-associated endonuclease Cas2 [Desulfoglaeba alkanexedens ALDC]